MTENQTAQRKKNGPLSESNWVEAAMEIMLQENIKGIKISTLCTKLGVTKGSFYWHFARRSDLLAAMLKEWRKRTTMDVIRAVTNSGEIGFQRIRKILKGTRHPRAYHYVAIEMNIRDWARRNDMPRDAIEEVDNIRIKFYEQTFLEEGFPEDEARRRAYMTYCFQMGDAVLNRTLKNYVSDEDFLNMVIDCVKPDDTPSKKRPPS
ncbi:MAG: TetR/AcrR family transcriptional regulator [Magnetospiraceae bacterium]